MGNHQVRISDIVRPVCCRDTQLKLAPPGVRESREDLSGLANAMDLQPVAMDWSIRTPAQYGCSRTLVSIASNLHAVDHAAQGSACRRVGPC